MKIRDRLSLQFTGIFAVLLFLVLAGIYITTEKNRRIDFNDRLYDRALTVAELYLAEDNLSKEKFRDVQRKFPLFLPDEIIRIYDNAYQPVFIKQDEYQWPKEVIDRVVGHKQISYRLGSRQVVGLYYNDNSGNFVVLISANDTYGFKRMHELFIDMLFAYVLSLFIMFLLGRLFSRNALSPIQPNGVAFGRSANMRIFAQLELIRIITPPLCARLCPPRRALACRACLYRPISPCWAFIAKRSRPIFLIPTHCALSPTFGNWRLICSTR